MSELLQEVFELVCCQSADHSWAPGGEWLPFCQRCTGLYVGGAAAAAFHVVLRPRANSKFLWLHGLFLLVMAPLGFHWVPQGPVVRTLSGLLFASGVISFLWLLPSSWLSDDSQKHHSRKLRAYLLCIGVTLLVVPASAAWGGRLAAWALSWIGLFGLLTYGTLALANLWFLVVLTAILLRRVDERTSS